MRDQIINVLKHALRDMKLKTLGEDLWTFPTETDDTGVQEKEQDRSLLTLRDLIHKLTVDEQHVLSRHFYWYEVNDREEEARQMTTQLEPGDETIDDVLRFSSFTLNDYNHFIEDVNDCTSFLSERKREINLSDLALKIVNVEGHWIPFTLASVMKHVLHKYGDISRASPSSPAMKSVCYFFFCQVLQKMHSTLIMDITKDLLQDWSFYMKFVCLCAMFNVRFMESSLEEITRAFFYLQVSRLDREVPTILQSKIAKYKAKLETCMELHESCLHQEFMKKGLNKLMKLKWKTAGKFRFDESCLK